MFARSIVRLPFLMFISIATRRIAMYIASLHLSSRVFLRRSILSPTSIEAQVALHKIYCKQFIIRRNLHTAHSDLQLLFETFLR
jgi:hypothetical protein